MWDFLGNLASAGIGMFTANNKQKSDEAIAAQNIAMQREFAQNGIRWKVADAQAAGLHPLAALGAQTTSFSPVSIDGGDFSSVGQDIGRAVAAMKTKDERADEVSKKVEGLTLEKASLENDLLRSQIRRLNSTGTGPGMPGSARKPETIVGRTVSENAPVKEDDIKQKAEDYPATKVGRPFGYPLPANPYFGDGQSFEDRYGDSEIGSTIKFATNMLADHAYLGYKYIYDNQRPTSPYNPYTGKRFRKVRPWGE